MSILNTAPTQEPEGIIKPVAWAIVDAVLRASDFRRTVIPSA